MKTLIHGKAVEKVDILPAALVVSALLLAIRTHTNDDRSKPGTKERDRFVERDAIMREAHALIEDMAGKVADAERRGARSAAEVMREAAANILSTCDVLDERVRGLLMRDILNLPLPEPSAPTIARLSAELDAAREAAARADHIGKQLESVQEAFLKTCEAIGIQATALSYLDAKRLSAEFEAVRKALNKIAGSDASRDETYGFYVSTRNLPNDARAALAKLSAKGA